MTAFEPGRPALDAELQIHQVQSVDETGAIAVVRCIRGPVRLGARFYWVCGAVASINLEVTRILCYGHPVDTLDPVHSALVTLRGSGARELRPGSRTSGWQIIQGSNPAA